MWGFMIPLHKLGLDQMIFEVSLSPNSSMILWNQVLLLLAATWFQLFQELVLPPRPPEDLTPLNGL